MKSRYLDASAFVKIVAEEPESRALREFLSRRRLRLASSTLLRAEVLRAVRHSGPDARATVRDTLRRVDLVAVDDGILESAGMLEPAIRRTLDAIHLATALALGEDLEEIVTYDARMAEGARLLGFTTVSPR